MSKTLSSCISYPIINISFLNPYLYLILIFSTDLQLIKGKHVCIKNYLNYLTNPQKVILPFALNNKSYKPQNMQISKRAEFSLRRSLKYKFN